MADLTTNNLTPLISTATRDQQDAQGRQAEELNKQIEANALAQNEEDQPFVSFNSPSFFRELVADRGLADVTKEVVDAVNVQFPNHNFTYEQLRDGTADILEFLPDLDHSGGSKTRALTDEAILSLFTDVEDYGKFDSPQPVLDPETGEQLIDPETGRPLFDETYPKLSAVGAGIKESVIPAALSLPGAIAGASGAVAQAPTIPGLPGILLKTGAAIVGGFVGGGVGAVAGDFIDDLIFDDSDPILLPSLQSSYNFGETLTYGVSALATPLVAVKIPTKPIVESFQGAKFLENFRGVSSGRYDPKVMEKALLESLGRRQLDKAIAARDVTPSTGISKLIEKVTPDAAKGPVTARMTTGLVEGSSKAMQLARENPKTALAVESGIATVAGAGAYVAEEVSPNNPYVRLSFELGSGMGTVPVLKATKKVVSGVFNGAKNIFSKQLTAKTQAYVSSAVSNEANARIYEFISTHPDFIAAENPDEQMNAIIKIFTTEQPESQQLVASQFAEKEFGVNSSTANILKQIDRELQTSSQALAVATDEGKEQFVSQAKRNIEALARTGNPDALRLASVIQQEQMQKQIAEEIQAKVMTLENSLKKLYGDDQIPQDISAELAPKLFALLEKSVQASKARERALWNSVPDFELREFKDINGEPSTIPQMVSVFDTPADEGGLQFLVPGSDTEFKKLLGDYSTDIEDVRAYFARSPADSGIVEPLPSERRLQNTENNLQGKSFEEFDANAALISFNRDLEPLNHAEKVKKLRVEAARYRVLGTKDTKKQTPVVKGIGKYDSGLSEVSFPDGSIYTISKQPGIQGYYLERGGKSLSIGDTKNDALAWVKNDHAKSQATPRSDEDRGTANLLAKAFDQQADVLISLRERDLARSAPTDEPSGNPLTVKFIQEIRTNLRAKARSLRGGSAPNLAGANKIDKLVQAMDNDLLNVNAENIFLTPEGEMLTVPQAEIVAAYNAARNYTFARNEIYTRSFIGNINKQKADGSNKTDPQGALNLLKSGQKILPMRVRELVRASQAIDDPTDPRATNVRAFPKDLSNKFEDVDSLQYKSRLDGNEVLTGFDPVKQELELNEIAEQIVRDARRQITDTTKDPITGEVTYTVNLKKLEQYVNSTEGQEMFSIFPTLKQDLDSAGQAQQLFNRTSKEQNVFSMTDENKAFRLFLNSPESSATAMSAIMSGQTLEGAKIAPARTLQNLVDRIKVQGDITTEDGVVYTTEDILNGFRSSIINAAALKNGNFGIKFNAKGFSSTLFDPLPGVDLSYNFNLMDFMKKNGIVDDEYVKNLNRYIKEINTVDEAVESGDVSKILFQNSTMAKISGVKIAGAMAYGASLQRFKALLKQIGLDDFGWGAGQVAGSEGAKAGEKLFSIGPETATIQEMVRIMENPKALGLALKSASNAEKQNAIIDEINQSLGGMVINRLPYIRKEQAADEPEENPITFKYLDRVRQAASPPVAPIVPVAPPTPPVVAPPLRAQPQLQQPVPPPTQVQAPVAPPTVSATRPVDRSQYAALFPNDMASGIIRSQDQGIGSLMG